MKVENEIVRGFYQQERTSSVFKSTNIKNANFGNTRFMYVVRIGLGFKNDSKLLYPPELL